MSGREAREAPTRKRLVPLPVIYAIAGIVTIAVGVGVYFAVTGGDAGGKKAKAKADLASAEAAFQAADYERASSLYSELAEADPDDLEIKRSLARSLAAGGDIEGAIATYGAITKAAPNDADAWYQMAALEQLAGDATSAIAHYEAAIEADADPQYLQALAPVYSQVGKWAESVAAWEQYLEVATLDEKGKAGVYAAIASAYENAREYDKAAEALEQAVFLDPNNETYKARLEAYED